MILFYFSQEMCFFVKQKTAYEMRISDWSSDVCSSDLPVQGVLVMLWETMGLMLAGMALFRAHMLTGEWAAGRYRKWAIVSFTVTIPPLAALAAWQIGAGFDAVTVFGATAALSLPFDLVMTLGWAALIDRKSTRLNSSH